MDRFAVSDLHLGHSKILEFTDRKTGERIRPFTTLDEMHDLIIKNWNSVVKPTDKVYIVGDLAVGDKTEQAEDILCQLNGTKEIILGNHDKFSFILFNKFRYEDHFRTVHGALMERFYIRTEHTEKSVEVCFTHIPIHPSSLGDRIDFNIHGHLHSAHVTRPYFVSEIMEWADIADDRYINVSLEALNFTPVKIVDILQERHNNIQKWNQQF